MIRNQSKWSSNNYTALQPQLANCVRQACADMPMRHHSPQLLATFGSLLCRARLLITKLPPFTLVATQAINTIPWAVKSPGLIHPKFSQLQPYKLRIAYIPWNPLADIKCSKDRCSTHHIACCPLPTNVNQPPDLISVWKGSCCIRDHWFLFVHFLSPFWISCMALHFSLACFTLDLMPLTLPHCSSPPLPFHSTSCNLWLFSKFSDFQTPFFIACDTAWPVTSKIIHHHCRVHLFHFPSSSPLCL